MRPETEEEVHFLDLRGVKCPLSWARAVVRIEDLHHGEILVLLLDDPKALRDIPRAAETAGHVPRQPTRDGDHWRLPIEV
jgi:TusA-related sulfurtransferase